MKRICSRFSATIFIFWLALFPVEAKIVGYEGGWSNVDEAPAVIPAPIAVLDDMVTNNGMQGFDEAQGVITTVAHAFDAGFIPAGSLIDSHMIFLNSPGNYRKHTGVKWIFDGVIIGVMSDEGGEKEHASTPELGSPLTEYPDPTFSYRGLELNDGYSFTGNPHELVVSMQDQGYESGDWIRVVTAPAAALEVEIEIKPGGNPNSINCKSGKGILPVAILSTADFDALNVDHTTVSFEGATETHMDKKSAEPRRHEEDVDGDDDMDLVFHFRVSDTALTCESDHGILVGRLWDGTEITGTAEVSMVPANTIATVP